MAKVLEALVVDPEGESYNRLKTAARSLQLIETSLTRSLEEARKRLEQRELAFPIIFISSSLPRKELTVFLEEAAELPGGKGSAYILLIAVYEGDAHAITSRLMEGLDGFLQEPFSVDGMHAVVDLARKLMHQRQEERVKAAIRIAIADLLTYVDANATSRDATFSRRVNPRGVLQLKKTLSELYRIDADTYFEELISTFVTLAEERTVREEVDSYSGASRRVKRMLKKKLVSEGASNIQRPAPPPPPNPIDEDFIDDSSSGEDEDNDSES